MPVEGSSERPNWVSDQLFPFKSRFFSTPDGHRMHYVDEGSGPPIVFVHGNPSWSFEFRNLISELRSGYRCVVPDHIGFGLSSRGLRPDDHHPEAHARRFAELMRNLDIKCATLFLTDWGGPIGLDFARQNPDRISRLVLANTWCWPVSRDLHFMLFSFMMRSWLGQYLIKRRNFFVNKVMPMAVGDKSVLTSDVMDHYRNAQPPGQRAACAALPGHIIGASDWLNAIWEDRRQFTGKPTLIFWGCRDIAFRRKELETWKNELPTALIHEFEDCGHFLPEEAPDRMLEPLRRFIAAR